MPYMKLQTIPLTCETEPSEIQFLNCSDYEVVACYSGLYEENEVEHINGPTHPVTIWKPTHCLRRKNEVVNMWHPV